jgi:hypothetical protein
MTKEQLTEYLERTHSTLSADLDQIVTTTTTVVFSLDRKERPYIFNTLNILTEMGEEVLDAIEDLRVKLCK